MKTGARHSAETKAFRRSLIFSTYAVCATLLAFAGCGKGDKDETPEDQFQKSGINGGDDQMSVTRGFAAFGTRCSAGFAADPKAIRLNLWSCPVNLPVVELAQPIQPLIFQADCARKLLTIRSQDNSVNTTWEIMPDSSFNITQEGLYAKLKSDGRGNDDCVTPISADLWGKVECEKSDGTSDKAKIRFETVMWINKTDTPVPRGMVGKRCVLPSPRCYLHAFNSVDQCT